MTNVSAFSRLRVQTSIAVSLSNSVNEIVYLFIFIFLFTAVGVTYDDRECVHYFRVESSKYPSPTKSGYFLVGSTPLIFPKK